MRPGLRGAVGEVCGVARVVRARAADDGCVRADLVEDGLEELDRLVIGERGPLAGRSRDDDAVRAVLDQVRGELARALDIERAIVGKRRDHRRQDSFERRHRVENYPANVGATRSAQGSARSSCAATWIRRSSRPCAATS